MATAKWATPSAQGANIAGTTLDSLPATGSNTSAFVTYDNATNLDLYANVEIDLGSITPTTGGSITLRVFATANAGASVPDATGSVGGGDAYTVPLTVSASAKIVTIPMIRLYPFSMRLAVTNNAGVALAATGNAIKVQPFNESVA
jgi:hypothetical protein